jgi:hypothetical protein
VLIEQRQEIMEEVPAQMTHVRLLLAQVRRPTRNLASCRPCIRALRVSMTRTSRPSCLPMPTMRG